MRIVFAGTPEFAVPALQKICGAGYEVAAVLTQPDRPQGRKRILTPSSVKVAAEALSIPVLQPEKLRADYSALKAVGADLMVTCAYGQILSQEVLDLFPMGVWNIHASLLPAYRGAAPIPRAVIEGERETGITIMKTDIGLDTGDILCAKSIAISDMDTAGSLSEKLSALGAEMIAEALARIESGNFALIKQGEGQVCKKVQRTEVDFAMSAREISWRPRLITYRVQLMPVAGSYASMFWPVLSLRGGGSCGHRAL